MFYFIVETLNYAVLTQQNYGLSYAWNRFDIKSLSNIT